MRVPRLFLDTLLTIGKPVILPKEAAHYMVNVLRLRVGDSVILFNGHGGEYTAQLLGYSAKTAHLQVDHFENKDCESPLSLTLVQAVSRSEHFDYTIQKSVELGVQRIVPVMTERSPPLGKDKFQKRIQHWRKIVISACEQCGRNRIPALLEILPLSAWLVQPQEGICMVLSPDGKRHWRESVESRASANLPPLTVLIGPEGGFSEAEIQQAMFAGYTKVGLGPRILRTETAAVAMLAICQAWAGDLHL